MKHVKYPSIEQYTKLHKRIKSVAEYTGRDEQNNPIYDETRKKPVLHFIRTVKMHGTNAGIQYHKNGDLVVQNRNKILDEKNHNYYFYNYVMDNKDYFKSKLNELLLKNNVDSIIIYGEWCGKKISKKVALANIEPSFIVFDIAQVVGDEPVWLPLDNIKVFNSPDNRCYNTLMFDVDECVVDFNDDSFKNDFVTKIKLATEDVAKECPVAKYMGVEGVGEGVVYRTLDGQHRFKSASDKFAVAKVKSYKEVDKDKVNTVEKFIDTFVTTNRLEQGVQYLESMSYELTRKSTGKYIKWVQDDIVKEESDIIKEHNIDVNILKSHVADKARKYYFDYIDNLFV